MKGENVSNDFGGLRFPPPTLKVYPGNLARGAAFVLLAVTALATGGLAIDQVLSNAPIEGPGGLWGSVFFLGVICFLASFYGFMVTRVRGFRVLDGVMTLVAPVRTASGSRIRRVALEEIVSAERIRQAGADPGILVTLKDGTKFPVFDGDLPGGGGRSFLDRLAAQVSQVPRKDEGSGLRDV